MIETCERCGFRTHHLETCTYCGKKICRRCEKSSKTVKKVKRLIICKTCWGNISARREFKRA